MRSASWGSIVVKYGLPTTSMRRCLTTFWRVFWERSLNRQRKPRSPLQQGKERYDEIPSRYGRLSVEPGCFSEPEQTQPASPGKWTGCFSVGGELLGDRHQVGDRET